MACSNIVRIPAKLITCSAANWTVIPAQTGHYERSVAREFAFYPSMLSSVKRARRFRSESPFSASMWAL